MKTETEPKQTAMDEISDWRIIIIAILISTSTVFMALEIAIYIYRQLSNQI